MARSAIGVALVVLMIQAFLVALLWKRPLQSCKCLSEKHRLGRRSSDGSDATSEEISKRFNETWPSLKRRLCPNMIPNVDMGPKIFQLARDELQMKSLTAEALGSNLDFSGNAHSRAFKFAPGGWSFAPNGVNPGGTNTTVYLRIYKAANDQIRYWAKETLADKGILRFFADSLKEMHATHDTCIVTVMRDPIERFLSAYNEIEHRLAVEPQRLQDPHPLLYTRYQNGTKARFIEFIADYVGGPERAGWKWFQMELEHVWGMSGLLYQLSKHQLRLTDYMASLKNLSSSWPKFLADTCPGLPDEAIKVPMKITSQHDSSNDPFGNHAAAKAVWVDQSSNTARALCALNVLEYACFDKLDIHNLCKDVYSRASFVSAVLHQEVASSMPTSSAGNTKIMSGQLLQGKTSGRVPIIIKGEH